MDGRPTAAAAGKIDVGGDLTANRLKFGAMRITCPGSGVTERQVALGLAAEPVAAGLADSRLR